MLGILSVKMIFLMTLLTFLMDFLVTGNFIS